MLCRNNGFTTVTTNISHQEEDENSSNVVCQLTDAELTEEEIPEFLAHPEQVHPGDEIFAVVETDNGKFLDEEIEIDPKQEPPRLTHRLHGKQTWPPVLCAVRTGG